MTTNPNHMCARCGVADESVSQYPDCNEHKVINGCVYAALQREVAAKDVELKHWRNEYKTLETHIQTTAIAQRDAALIELAALRVDLEIAQQQWEAERKDHDATWKERDALRDERQRAMDVMKPNMPGSGLEDACRQVKQVALTWESNYAMCVAQDAALREREEQMAVAFAEYWFGKRVAAGAAQVFAEFREHGEAYKAIK